MIRLDEDSLSPAIQTFWWELRFADSLPPCTYRSTAEGSLQGKPDWF